MRGWNILGLAVASLVLGSCASAGPPSVTPEGPPESVSDHAQAEDPTEGQTDPPLDVESPFDYESPLVAFLGIESGFSVESHIKFEEAVAACMAAEGFEYWPRPIPLETFGLPSESGEPAFGSDEWIEVYGFGISTQAFSQREVEPDLVGHRFSSTTTTNDSNSTYRESLPSEEQKAYDLALYGHPHDRDQAGEADPGSAVRDDNCTIRGRIESNGGVNMWSFNDEFNDDLSAMYRRIPIHPRIEAARVEAAECLIARGMEFGRFDQVREHIDARLHAVLAVPGSEPSQVPGEGSLSEEARDLLGEIQADEIFLARAFRDCGAPNETLQGYADPLFKEVRIELEEEFLEDNRVRLEAFLVSQGVAE